jgi:hypothetical protein
MAGSESRTSCKLLFQSLEILTLPLQYILSSMIFLSYNFEIYTFNFSVHGINTRNKLQLHKPTANLTLYQKGVYYASIKIFNELPEYTTKLVRDRKGFISTFKKYLVSILLFT